MTVETGMLTKAQRELAKEIILRVLANIAQGRSHLGDDGGITNLELAEVLGLVFYQGRTTPTYIYELLKVLKANGLVKLVRVPGERSRFQITRAGMARYLEAA